MKNAHDIERRHILYSLTPHILGISVRRSRTRNREEETERVRDGRTDGRTDRQREREAQKAGERERERELVLHAGHTGARRASRTRSTKKPENGADTDGSGSLAPKQGRVRQAYDYPAVFRLRRQWLLGASR